MSPRKNWNRKHWKDQELGDIHGYDKYVCDHPGIPVLLSEIKNRASIENRILDIGCNCGYYLLQLKNNGFKNLAGVDISRNALEYGKTELHLDDVELMEGSFEEVLPGLTAENRQFECVYSMGATIELVHPSFDIVKSMCMLSSRYVILCISEWGHSYPRLYEYEFNAHGFALVKCIRPYTGDFLTQNPADIASLLVFQRIG